MWEHWGAHRGLRVLSQGSHGAGNAITTRGSPGKSGQDLSPRSARERAAQWPTRASGSAHCDRDLLCCGTWVLWVEPLSCFHMGSQKSPKDEDCGSLPAWAGSGGSQEMGNLHTVAPEPSIPLLPLSYHGQTGGCSLFYFTHSNYHLLPIFLKLIFGSEQTPRGGKAPDKKSVSL